MYFRKKTQRIAGKHDGVPLRLRNRKMLLICIMPSPSSGKGNWGVRVQIFIEIYDWMSIQYSIIFFKPLYCFRDTLNERRAWLAAKVSNNA